MSVKFYQQFLQVLSKGDAVLATVVKIQGSVPREIGAKMIIGTNGEIFNTIGGGAGEAKVCKIGQTVLKTGEKQAVTIDLSGVSHKPTEGVCGGLMQVWLEKWSGEEAIALVQKILDSLNCGQIIPLFTPYSSSASPYLLCDGVSQPSPETGFIEVLHPSPMLLIIGAGHVGEKLAKIADLIGFQVSVQDDRPEWANSSRYPQAGHVFTAPILSILPKIANHSQLYIAMVTRGYQYDLDALKAILENKINYRYLGMIGSKKRVKKVKKALEELNFSLTQLNSFYAPIGLDIGALTPEEIAVSIAAELILVRREGTGKPLSII